MTRIIRILPLLCLTAICAAPIPASSVEGSKPVKLEQTRIASVAGEYVDVAPFGEVRTWDEGKDIGVLWEDMRDIAKVIVQFAPGAKLPDPSTVKLQYWRDSWPENRIPRDQLQGSGNTGWLNEGDWYQGEWQDADVEVSRSIYLPESLVGTPPFFGLPAKPGSAGGVGPFDNVQLGHWAYAAVNELAKAGIITGYPDGTFGGMRAMTRFEFAQAVARAIPAVQRSAGPVVKQVSSVLFTQTNIEALRRLVGEFRDELAAMGVDLDALKRDVAFLGQKTPRSNEGIGLKITPIDVAGAPKRLEGAMQPPRASSSSTETWVFTFRPVNQKESPETPDFKATYRSTLKVRLLFPNTAPPVRSLHAFTDSVWRHSSATLEWGGTVADDHTWDGRVEAFNGVIGDLSMLAGWKMRRDGNTWNIYGDRSTGVKIDFWYAQPVGFNSLDETILTVRSKQHSFSFAAKDILGDKRIFIRDYGVLIKPPSDTTTYAQAEEAYQKSAGTLYDQIGELPEQTLAKTWNSIPEKSRIYMPLAVEGGRQHFNLEPNGDITISRNWQMAINGEDTAKSAFPGNKLWIKFGLPEAARTGAKVAEDVLPIPITWYENDGIRYAQEAFATTLSGRVAGRVRAEEPQVLMVRIRLTNLSGKTAKVDLPVQVVRRAGPTPLVEREGVLFTNFNEAEQGRMRVMSNGATLKCADKTATCSVELAPGGSHNFDYAISFQNLETPAEIEQIKVLGHDRQRAMIAGYWRKRIGQGTRIVTPEPMINAFYNASITHQLINTENEVGTNDRAMAKVGTLIYGVYGNESTMMTSDLDRRGYGDVAAKALESWLHYQGTKPLPGDYSAKDGVFQGANGYDERGSGYNQNQGWVLWGMAEHYWFTRDDAWLDRVAPKLVKGCDWITGQRNRTKTDECTGIRSIEYGLLPPGMLEDIVDYRCWLTNNLYSWWGMDAVARALAERNHPDAQRLTKEAADYKKDILNAFTEAMVRTPVVPLRDGTYIPNIPSEVHRRGRSFGWIMETLEGSIHMIRCGIIDPNSQMSTWIEKDFEDNRYISEQYGYQAPFFERDWFSVGGFSQQPNLLCGPTTYLMIDQPKHYVRSYLNSFAASYFPERSMMTEHPLPKLGDFWGDHFKTSDEAMNTSWLRWMFIWDEGEDLHLGRTMPRYWLADGNEVSIQKAQTHFGPMGMKMKSYANSGRIEMTITPPTRNQPKAIYARFRHPEGKTMNRVTVDGKPYDKFDPAKEWVVLPALTGKTVVAAYYD